MFTIVDKFGVKHGLYRSRSDAEKDADKIIKCRDYEVEKIDAHISSGAYNYVK